MSYSVDLWSSYNKVEKRLELNFKGLKEFIKVISEYYSVINTFNTNLKKIYDLKCTTSNESLQIGINGFKTDILNQYLALNDYLNSIKDDLIIPLTTLKDKVLEKIKNNLKETSSTEKTYRACVLQMDATKKKFYSSIKDTEQYKIKYELSKNKQIYKDINDLKDYNVIESDEVKIITAIKTAKDNEKEYINNIENTNIMQDEYIEIKKKNLNQIQNLEEELGENLKDCLRKYVIFKISYLRNLQYDIDKKAKIMENIDIRKDIFDYINKNATNAIPPEKYAYLPYLCDVGIKNNLFLQKEIINEVKTFINNTFSLKNSKETIMSTKPKNYINIENIAFNSFNDKKLTNDEKKDIISISSLKRSRRYLLEQLNKIRLKNGLNLTEISFNNIGDILKQCLTILEKENDYESYKLIIILACSLYKPSEEKNKPRIFLQNYIIDFPMWKNFEFWKNLIQYEINEEMIKQKKYNMFNRENEDYKLKRINLIAKSQLNTYLFNMISFGADNMMMNDIILYFRNYYFLEQNIVDSLNNIIKNYSNNKNDKDIEKIITDKKKDETISDIGTKNETVTTNDNEENDEVEILRNVTFNIEGNILDNLMQKQPCDNILKAKRRHKKEKEEKELNKKIQNIQIQNNNANNINNINNNNNINQNKENNENIQDLNNLNNLNINLINRDNNDNNDDINFEKDEIDLDKNINYLEINDSAKSKKRNSDGYKEEDIVSKIAITEFSADKNDTFDTFSIRENSNLNIINDDINK